MFIDEIKPGMEGYGKSVFSGTQIETFTVKILSVMDNFSPGHSIILAELSDNPNVEEGGIISGMSGSPVYLNGRLIGAVAYSWGFSKKPIAGITPIKEMLDLKDRKIKNLPADFEFFGKLPSEDNGLRYIQTPITMTGFNRESIDDFKNEFKELGFLPVQSGGVGLQKLKLQTLVPGSPIAVQLVQGSMSVSAIGTVTYVRGKEVYALGHPMFNGGNVNVPMGTAYIHTTIPSFYNSFKIGSSVTTVGTFLVDSTPGTYGELGAIPKMVNASIKLNDKNFSVEIIDNKYLLGSLLRTVILNIILAETKEIGDLFIEYNIKMYSGEKELLDYSDIMTSELIFDTVFGIGRMLRFFTFIKNNPEEEVFISDIKIEMKSYDAFKRYTLQNIELNKTSYFAGEDVNLKLLLKQDKKPEITKDVSFNIPKDVKPGNYYLLILDAIEDERQRVTESPKFSSLDNLDEINDWIEGSHSLNEVNLRLVAGESGLNINNQEYSDTPPTFYFLQQVSPSRQGIATNLKTLKEEVIKFDAPVSGSKQIIIKITKGTE
ncbi:MAG: SpoIVB peptidase S55 domain-containing protein [bacterium]|nr:SpoIVB peptidase S55 domain-containing protein [bacterium]